MFKFLRQLFAISLRYLTDNRGGTGAVDTDESTLEECMPTIIASALLELEEGNVVAPLVTDVPFGGTGITHNTPFISKVVAETDDDLATQSMDSTTDAETSPSTATVELPAVVKSEELLETLIRAISSRVRVYLLKVQRLLETCEQVLITRSASDTQFCVKI